MTLPPSAGYVILSKILIIKFIISKSRVSSTKVDSHATTHGWFSLFININGFDAKVCHAKVSIEEFSSQYSSQYM